MCYVDFKTMFCIMIFFLNLAINFLVILPHFLLGVSVYISIDSIPFCFNGPNTSSRYAFSKWKLARSHLYNYIVYFITRIALFVKPVGIQNGYRRFFIFNNSKILLTNRHYYDLCHYGVLVIEFKRIWSTK